MQLNSGQKSISILGDMGTGLINWNAFFLDKRGISVNLKLNLNLNLKIKMPRSVAHLHDAIYYPQIDIVSCLYPNSHSVTSSGREFSKLYGVPLSEIRTKTFSTKRDAQAHAFSRMSA